MHSRNPPRAILTLALLLSAGAAVLFFSFSPDRDVTGEDRPQLLLFITVDQLRGDMPLRFADRWGDRGFKRIMDRGVYYTNAHYRHSTTFTAVGHATLVTGGAAADHGMAGNDWYNVATGKRVYCVEDGRFGLIGKGPKEHEGTSPRNLTSSTIGDELVAASGGRSRVFSVSIKDRGAILPGGHRGKAFWYDKTSGQFVTSSYYYDAYPRWVENWNGQSHAEAYRGEWTLLRDHGAYLMSHDDDRPFERPSGAMGRTFPQRLDGDEFYADLRYTPMGDGLTVDFAERLLAEEGLGQRAGVTDMLAVSLSATDYIGHAFGPNSLEAEDNMLRLDLAIARLLDAVDAQIGFDRTVVVLSSDHGVDAAPEYYYRLQNPSAPAERLATLPVGPGCGDSCGSGRHTSNNLMELANEKLRQALNVKVNLVAAFWNPGFYLDLNAVREAGLTTAKVERTLANLMQEMDGIALAVTRTDLMAGRTPRTAMFDRIQRAFHPTRSGNVLIVQAQHWFLYSKESFAAMHGSPHSYDTYVPVMIAGPRIKSARIHRHIGPDDIAPTLSIYLGVQAPSGSSGEVLTEVLD